MRTLGVDFAAQPKTTAVCVIRWFRGRGQVEVLEAGVADERLRELAGDADRVGLDVPFGWPDAFVESIAAHRDSRPWPGYASRQLRFRRTDLFVQERIGTWPLSVSTDRIGVAAFRAAALLSEWRVDRSGRGKFVEVYPRAARRRFGLANARSLVELQTRAPWLVLAAAQRALCEVSEDCFDALIASLVARAAALGLCEGVPAADRERAAREGWIALPLEAALERLPAC